jgi:hypothetical protein
LDIGAQTTSLSVLTDEWESLVLALCVLNPTGGDGKIDHIRLYYGSCP